MLNVLLTPPCSREEDDNCFEILDESEEEPAQHQSSPHSGAAINCENGEHDINATPQGHHAGGAHTESDGKGAAYDDPSALSKAGINKTSENGTPGQFSLAKRKDKKQ